MESPSFFDAHTHVQFAAFKEDWRAVIDRALAGGVWMINIGTQRDTSRRAIEVAESYPAGVYAAVGLHPVHTGISVYSTQPLDGTPSNGSSASTTVFQSKPFRTRGEQFDFEYYRSLAAHPKVLAIGECGLDYHRLSEHTDVAEIKRKQRTAFEQQIHLARAIDKPLMIHCREAFDDLIETFRELRGALRSADPGLVHYFTGTTAHASALLDLGFSFTFGGAITWSRDYDEVIRTLPPDRILAETDAPYVAPAPHRDERNEPVFVIDIVRALADLRQMELEAVREQTLQNAGRVFGLLLPFRSTQCKGPLGSV
jgi:TatD DNase family protein